MAFNVFNLFKKKNDSKRRPRLGEVGLSGISDWERLVGRSYNPSDIDIGTYKEMMKDSQIKAACSLIRLSTLSRSWRVTLENQGKKEEKIIEFVKYNLDHIQGRVSGSLSNILTAIPYGFSTTEIVWKVINEGKHKGKIGLKKLKGLDPEEIEIITDKYGNLDKVTQRKHTNEIDIPKDKVIIYTNEKEFGNWYGTSRLRSVYKNWFIKNAIIKFWNIALERFGQPLLKATVPSENDIDKALKLLNNVQNRTSIAHQEGWEIEFLEAMRREGGNHKEAIDYHNRQIMLGLLAPPDLLGMNEGGSKAKAKVQFDVFTLMLRNLENDICGIVEEYLIKPLVKYNFGEVEKYPEFSFEPMSMDERLGLARSFALLVKNQIVDPDEEWIRDVLGIPRSKQATVSPAGTSKTKDDKKGSQQVKTPQPQRNPSQSLMKELDLSKEEQKKLEELIDKGKASRFMKRKKIEVLEKQDKLLDKFFKENTR